MFPVLVLRRKDHQKRTYYMWKVTDRRVRTGTELTVQEGDQTSCKP